MPYRLRLLLSLFLVLFTLNSIGQDFYVSYLPISMSPQSFSNKLYKLNISTPDTIPIFACETIIDTVPNIIFTDIAFDSDSNIWCVTQKGDLYKRKLNDTTCSYIGDFNVNGNVTALVDGNNGILYAVGDTNGKEVLFRYDSSGFAVVGQLPAGITSSGDLFFYGPKLFITCYGSPCYLAEISLDDPSQTLLYMTLKGKSPYAAFSVGTEAYVVYSSLQSQLVKLDIPNKTESATIQKYPFHIGGAAAYYNIPPDTGLSINNTHEETFFGICNPCFNNIVVKSGITDLQISNLYVYDISGRRIKNFSKADYPYNLDISNLPGGLYVFQLLATDGRKWHQKFFKSAP